MLGPIQGAWTVQNLNFPMVFDGFRYMALLHSTSVILSYVGPYRPHRGLSWGHSGAFLGLLWAILGLSGAPLWPSRALLEPHGGHHEADLAHPSAFLGHLGAIVGYLGSNWSLWGVILG